MQTLTPYNAPAYIARYSSAVVSPNNYWIDRSLGDGYMQSDIYLREGVNINFHATDDVGNIGMIFLLDRFIPRYANVDHVSVVFSELYGKYMFSRTTCDDIIFIVDIEDESQAWITATG